MSYKKAPTWLFNSEGETCLFKTQEEVDTAWDKGWFGPRGLAKSNPLISTVSWETKQDMIYAVKDDPRYAGLDLRLREKTSDLLEAVEEFEVEHDIKVE